MPRSLWLAGLGVTLMFQWGIAAVPSGVTASSAARYHGAKGELKVSVAAPLDRVWKGTLDVVKEMEYGTTRRRKDAIRAEVGALTARQTPIEIHLKAVSGRTTRISIRVGESGSEQLSRILLEKIARKI